MNVCPASALVGPLTVRAEGLPTAPSRATVLALPVERGGARPVEVVAMAAELRQDPEAIFVVDVECGIEEDWGDDVIGAGVRVDEHNEEVHPVVAAGPLDAG